MRLLSILGIASLSISGVSAALVIEGEPNVNDTLVLQHLKDRQKLIALEKTHRQGSFQTFLKQIEPDQSPRSYLPTGSLPNCQTG